MFRSDLFACAAAALVTSGAPASAAPWPVADEAAVAVAAPGNEMARSGVGEPGTASEGAMTFGTATAAPGTKALGVLAVPAGSDAALDIPIIVIRGASPGPTVALIAGLHGAEYAGIVALQRLQDELDPRTINGTVIIIPVVNTPGFEAIVRRINPVDGKNMNRFFPGDPQGTQTQRASDILTREVLARADYVIDYHGGDLSEDQTPYAYWITTSDSELTARERAMLAAFGLPYVIRFPFTDTNPSTARLLPTQAVALGKPTITVDAGRSGTYTGEDIDLLVNGTRRTLGYLGVTRDQGPASPAPQEIVRSADVESPQTGIFHPLVQRGQRVRRGERLGVVRSYHGDRSMDVIAPADAVVLYLNSTPAALEGEQLFFLGVADQ